MTPPVDSRPSLSAELAPAHVLVLAEEVTAFRDLRPLEFSRPAAPSEALTHAGRADDLADVAKAVRTEIGKVEVYVTPAVEDAYSRIRLLGTQATLAGEHLRLVHAYLVQVSPQERAHRPYPHGRVIDTLLEAGHHLREASLLTSLGASDALRAATDLAGALRAQKLIDGRPQAMSPTQYQALRATATGRLSVEDTGGREWAWMRDASFSMATVRSLESRGWVRREAHHPWPGARTARLYLTETGRLVLASRLGRAPVDARPRAIAVQHTRTRVR
ncbi:hypothetical protein ACFTZM_08005 [Streptomyces hydrogenans]|uniref:hypothetical protein n=1 Tax=Streptomyces hydrogenans TaxID=1873719 RepID=UPI00363CE726